MTSRRIVFIDVDGTILDHGKGLQQSTVDAVRAARAAGHIVMLATGRSAGDIRPEVRDIGFDGAITNGGAYSLFGDRTIVADPMPADAVRRVTEWFDDHGVAYFLQTDHAVHATREAHAMMIDLARRHGLAGDPDGTEENFPTFLDIAEADPDDVAKAVFISDDPGFVELAKSELGERFHVIPGSLPLPGGSNGEIGMAGTTKGSAIEQVLAHLGIEASRAIGIGDSWNDVEMFQVCGTGIAMGNADDALKQIADEVTTSVTDHGVANAFRRHGLV